MKFIFLLEVEGDELKVITGINFKKIQIWLYIERN
jgi:hypothetical protein